MKCRAAILVELKKPLVIEEIEIPALGFGQVLVQVECTGICGSQIGEIKGVKGPDNFLPHLLGHEAYGHVREVGEGVRFVKPGDPVVLHWRPGAGLPCVPPKFSSRLGLINAGWVTTFNELAVVAENRVTKVPDGLDAESGALMGCAVTTGFGVVNNNARLRIGESILVVGAGGIGLNIIQAAAMVSADPIIAVDLLDNRLELARKLGATHLINSKTCDMEAAVRELMGKDGVDVAVDNTGNVKMIEAAYRLTSAHGRTVLVGVPPKGSEVSLYTLPLHFEKELTGSHGGESRPHLDIPRYASLCLKGKLRLNELVGRRYRLEEINQAIEDMQAGTVAGRCLIHM